MEEKDILAKLDDVKTGLEGSLNEKVQKAVVTVQSAIETGLPEKIKAALTENLKTINEGLKEMADWKKERSEIDPKNQQALDNILVQLKNLNKSVQKDTMKTFGELYTAKMNDPEIQKQLKGISKNRSLEIIFKNDDDSKILMDMQMDKKVMTVAGSLTGEGIVTYRPEPAIIPSQKINFRDLVNTTFSNTLTYVHYLESAHTGSIDEQTEGSAKSTIEFPFTRVSNVSKYIAGTTRFSKQLTFELNFLQSILPRVMLREFYKEENNYFIDKVASTATGDTTTAETDDVKQLIDYIGNQMMSDFNASAIVVNHRAMASLRKLTYVTGYYAGSGGVVSTPGGGIVIEGVPVIAATWMNAGKAMLYDRDWMERIECSAVKVEFFEQDQDNVPKNLLTARIECLEELNIIRPTSVIYATL